MVITTVLGMPGALPWLVVFALSFFVAKRLLRDRIGGDASSKPSGRGGYPADFNASYAHDNIAIDQAAGKLWVRDKSGRATVVDKGDVLRWKHTYHMGNGVWIKNCIEVEVRDLDRPRYEVQFNRHGDLLKWNAQKNAAECEEWQSRLTTWVNNT